MNLLYPKIPLRHLGWMALFAGVGSVIAGGYGVVHDQITYSLGQEYFTQFKFDQFYYLDAVQPERLKVVVIGYLATWWVGFFAGWFMARLTLPHERVAHAARRSLVGVIIMLSVAIAFAGVAYSMAPTSEVDLTASDIGWIRSHQNVTNPVAFIRVGQIHNASYLGGLVGLLAALIWLRWSRPQTSA